MNPTNYKTSLGRRAFLQGGTLVLAAGAIDAAMSRLGAAETSPKLRIGLVTDLHYADKPPAGSRHYRETLAKLTEAAARIAEANPNFVVELGDLIDAAAAVDVEQRYLRRINELFSTLSPDRHYVLGNHCVDMLTKDEFLAGIERQKSFYSFDREGTHFVVLDSCFRSDGEPYGRKNSHWQDCNIPAAELEWLKSDLDATSSKVIVFAHQRLDATKQHSVKNNAEVRKILELSGKVLAVFQGHSHQNDYQEIAGVHYCTLVAMVEGSGAENNGYSVLTIQPEGTLQLTGFRHQKNYEW
jgi:predicted MPP superfamily phosphohydrolase